MYKRIVIKLSGEALAEETADSIRYTSNTDDITPVVLSNFTAALKTSASGLDEGLIDSAEKISSEISRFMTILSSLAANTGENKYVAAKKTAEDMLFDIAHLISGGSRSMYNEENVEAICRQLIKLTSENIQVSVVPGGGNIVRGRNADMAYDRVKADYMGMLSTVINGIFLCDAIRVYGGSAVVLTPFETGNMTEIYRKDKTLSYMESGVIPIFAGGLGHPFFSTDTIPVIRALELKCDCVLFAKSIDGIYSDDPQKNKNAEKYEEISYDEMIYKNYKALDVTASVMLRDNKIPSAVFALNGKDSILRACYGEKAFGTKINF